MNVRFTPRALLEAKRIKAWWQRNRPAAPDLFDEEIAMAVAQLQTAPASGTRWPDSVGVVVRRVPLPKTQKHLYYAIAEGEVVVLSVWGAPRER